MGLGFRVYGFMGLWAYGFRDITTILKDFILRALLELGSLTCVMSLL